MGLLGADRGDGKEIGVGIKTDRINLEFARGADTEPRGITAVCQQVPEAGEFGNGDVRAVRGIHHVEQRGALVPHGGGETASA